MPKQLTKQSPRRKKRRAKGEGSLYQRADGRWEATVDLGFDGSGRRIRKRFTGRSQTDVSAKLRKVQHQVDTGTLPRAKDAETVATWLQRYLEDYADVKASTLESYEAIVRKHIIPILGRIPLAKVGADDIQRLIRAKEKAGLSPRRVQYIHAVLKMAFRQAVRSQRLTWNPVDATKPPKVQLREATVFDGDQARQFLDAVSGDRMAPLYVVALMTGLRRGELAGLKWSDVDLEAKTLTVRRTRVPVKGKVLESDPKTSKSRRSLTLPDKAVESLVANRAMQGEEKRLLGDHYHDEGWVFCWPDGKALRPEWITNRFNALLAQVGLPKIRLHDLRHTHATLLLLAGVQLKVVSDRLGHTTIVLTSNTYQHVLPAMEREAAAKMDKLFR